QPRLPVLPEPATGHHDHSTHPASPVLPPHSLPRQGTQPKVASNPRGVVLPPPSAAHTGDLRSSPGRPEQPTGPSRLPTQVPASTKSSAPYNPARGELGPGQSLCSAPPRPARPKETGEKVMERSVDTAPCQAAACAAGCALFGGTAGDREDAAAFRAERRHINFHR